MNCLYISNSVRKKRFILLKRGFFVKTNLFIISRCSNVLKNLIGHYFFIYNGFFFKKKYISKFDLGYKLGSFTWNRVVALYKKKLLKKSVKRKKMHQNY